MRLLRYLSLSAPRFLSAPKTLYILGFSGVAIAIWNFIQANVEEVRGLKAFDPSYHFADEAMAFAGAVTLLIAERLDGIDKRLKNLEDKNNVG